MAIFLSIYTLEHDQMKYVQATQNGYTHVVVNRVRHSNILIRGDISNEKPPAQIYMP